MNPRQRSETERWRRSDQQCFASGVDESSSEVGNKNTLVDHLSSDESGVDESSSEVGNDQLGTSPGSLRPGQE